MLVVNTCQIHFIGCQVRRRQNSGWERTKHPHRRLKTPLYTLMTSAPSLNDFSSASALHILTVSAPFISVSITLLVCSRKLKSDCCSSRGFTGNLLLIIETGRSLISGFINKSVLFGLSDKLIFDFITYAFSDL